MKTKTTKRITNHQIRLFVLSYLERKEEAKERMTILDIAFIEALLKSLK